MAFLSNSASTWRAELSLAPPLATYAPRPNSSIMLPPREAVRSYNSKVPQPDQPVPASPDPRALAGFYSRLLGWTIDDYDPGWSTIKAPRGNMHLSFQAEPNYRPPTWPTKPDSQQMMLHLDFYVNDLEAAHAHPVAVGATPTPWQPQPDVRVYTDPDGHVFCLAG